MSTVKVFETTYCPYCTRAKQFLSSHDVEFERVDVTRDAAKRNWLVEATGMRTVPQIFVGDTVVGGYDDLQKMYRDGTLFRLLADNDVAYTE